MNEILPRAEGFRLAIVIPVTAGREDNLKCVLAALDDQRTELPRVIVVDDGGRLVDDLDPDIDLLRVRKHEPGREQPRNIGVRWAKKLGATHCWFVDSDVVLVPTALSHINAALAANPDRVLVGPYEWLSGQRPGPDFWPAALNVRNDPRWAMFDASPPEREYRDDLSAALACWSGNLVWPVAEFERVGGFWSELHHGRCEDGELGLRACAMQVPISFVAGARGFHLQHSVNTGVVLARNARDVPMLNARHPWVQGSDIFLSDRDGAAFDVRCPCGEVVHTNRWWAHAADCPHTSMQLPRRDAA